MRLNEVSEDSYLNDNEVHKWKVQILFSIFHKTKYMSNHYSVPFKKYQKREMIKKKTSKSLYMENSTYKKYIYIFYFSKCKHIFCVAMGAMFLVLFIYICWSCRKLHNSSETNRILHTAKHPEKYSKNAKKVIHWERFYFTYINNTKLSVIWSISQKPVKCSLPFDRSYVTDRLSIPCEIQWFPYWKRCDRRMQYSCMKGVQF